jgi:transcriptional regulator with XRE-family HTH domain
MLGDRIREARAAKGWKQKNLAAEVDVEPITVSRWERGATTPDLDVLRLVAEATGRPLSYFVSDDDPPALDERVAALEQSFTRVEQKLDLLLQRLPGE